MSILMFFIFNYNKIYMNVIINVMNIMYDVINVHVTLWCNVFLNEKLMTAL